ncbi:uncharacterized protein LOC142324042 [Lycorma delicatula]|uniref:uncharacterized protein LOC142324042 n=1 Tax=Lycorma delicatula TaxID=130591 RepID=UPI003F50E431
MRLAGLGSQTRPCLRVTFCILCLLIIMMYYFFNDTSYVTYNELIWNLSNEYTFPETINGSYMQENNDSYNISLKEGYLVWSPSCRIPDIDPYHESIRSLVKKVSAVKCSQLPPLTRISNDKLIYDDKIAPKYADKQKITCCYQNIKRTSIIGRTMSNPDNSINLSPCTEFNKTVTLQEDEEYIMVKCHVPKRKGKKEVYGNVHARIIKKPSIEYKLKHDASTEDKLSVLFMGIDSISRLNLLRTMPNTVSFLKENDFIELKGYNKIDDNTFPNLIAILTGMTIKQFGKKCWKNRDKELDDCPLLWNNASRLGYLTAYVEDEPTMGTFNYHKKGFKNSPTDYYFRPFMIAAENYMKIKRVDSLEICLGPELTGDIILNYAKDFINRFKDTLHFSLFWMNSFSHNNVNTPSSMDKNMLNFFTDVFYNNETINSTAIIFLSDHGMRFGRIRETYVGWLEERLPFIWIWLPEWYRNKYKDRYNNLIINSNRLTSPYDLHLTVRDLIGITNNENEKNYTSDACPTCVSLFEQIPWNRSCENAGITEHWCTCSEYRTLSNQGVLVRAMVHYAVKEINIILQSAKNLTKNDTKCAKLGVKRVLTVRSMLYDKPVGHNDYVVIFETLPGASLFETTIRHDKTFQIRDSISRINGYLSQSTCVEDPYLKKYCFCTKKVNS